MDADPLPGGRGWEGRWILPAFFLGLALALAGVLPEHGLWFQDEPRVAGIGREMFDKGSFFLPLLGGRPFLEKPPLYWWAQMGSFGLFGVHPWSARLPAVLFSLLAMGAAFFMGRKLAGGKGGFLAVGVLGTTLLYSQTMHRALVDPALVFALSWAHFGLLCLHVPSSPAEKRRGMLLASFFLPLAFLAKGVVGIGLGLGPFLLYLVLRKRFREILELRPFYLLAGGFFLLLVVPWAVGLYEQGGPAALEECLLGNTLGRFFGTTTKYGHIHPPLFYLGTIAGRFMPWTLALPALLTLPPSRSEPEKREAHFTLLGFVGLGILLLSLASSKRSLYLVPLLPALSALLAAWMVRREAERPLDRHTLQGLLALSALLPFLAFLVFLLCPLLPGKNLYLARCREVRTPLVLAAFGLPALFWTLALGRKTLALVRTRSRPGPLLVLLPLAALFLVYQLLLPPFRDPIKSAHPISHAVAAALEGGGEGALFEPKEDIRGLLYFDLQRVFPELSREEVPRWLEGGKNRFLLVEEKKMKLFPPGVRAGWRTAWRSGGRKPYIILKTRK